MEFLPFIPTIGTVSTAAAPGIELVDWRAGLLVRSPNWLGDAVMSMPAVYLCRQRLPAGARLRVVCRAVVADLWRCAPWVDEVIPFSGNRLDRATRRRIQTPQPGATLVLPNSFGAAFDLWRAGLPHRIGRGGRGRGLLLHHRLPAWHRQAGADQEHEVTRWLELAAACGAPAWDGLMPPLVPTLDPLQRQPIDLLLGHLDNKPLLVLAPGASYGPAKQWPAARFRVIAERWISTGGMVLAVGAPGDAEAAAGAVAGLQEARAIAGKTTLLQLAYLLTMASAVVANDSGTMHLAAALGRPGVAIFGSTDPLATGPLGSCWYVLRQPLPCSPCLQRTCRRTDTPYECLQAISPDDVWAALQAATVLAPPAHAMPQ